MSDSSPCSKTAAAESANRPGLASIQYRVDQHAGFLAAMKAGLRGEPALREIQPSSDDPTVALLDAWATVLDVLTFYQERIANEHYLRTATERSSVLALARQIGYELRPGVAASTYLAFTLDPVSPTGEPFEITIPTGTQAQSVPASKDEKPQVFETIEDIEAKTAWNELVACTTEPYTPRKDDSVIYLAGVATNLGLGDGLLLIGSERETFPEMDEWDFRRVKTLEPIVIDVDTGAAITKVTLDRPLGSNSPFKNPAAEPRVYALRTKAAHFGHNAPDWNTIHDDVRKKFVEEGETPGDYADWPTLTIREIVGNTDWDTLYLDRLYPEIVVEAWVVVKSPTYTEVYRVTGLEEDARTGFALSAKTTKLTVEGENLEFFDKKVRELVVYGESELLEQTEKPIEEDVSGSWIDVRGIVEGMEAGRALVVTGTTTDDEVTEELVELSSAIADVDRDRTRLSFTSALEHTYDRSTVRVLGNVARATHGETRQETLGDGQGAKRFQTFTLANTPLTHVPAATPTGHESTLTLRVDGVEWHEVPALYGQDSEASIYESRLDDDAKTTVRFGDGKTGARLPTGSGNVTASYRVGSGLDGHVTANQIKLLTKKPLGVKSVANPFAPSGGDEQESLDDVQHFARAYPGIAKAMATRLWDGETRFVHVTVAGTEGDAVSTDSATYEFLSGALASAWHGAEEIRIESFEWIRFGVAAKLVIDGDYIAEDVVTAASAALVDAFSFASRALGQSVTAGEVMAVLQRVDGVVAVDLDELDGKDAIAHSRIRAEMARYVEDVGDEAADSDDDGIAPAQLVTIDSDDITLEASAS